jgi:hypothetical protein
MDFFFGLLALVIILFEKKIVPSIYFMYCFVFLMGILNFTMFIFFMIFNVMFNNEF